MTTDSALTQANNELVTISKTEINWIVVESVDWRELHKKLESKRDFSNWITSKLKKYHFSQWIDFTTKMLNRSDGKPGRQKKEYILTLDTAKEIAMVENNEKWREIRRYFIEVEKKLREKPQTLKIENQQQYIDTMVQAMKYTYWLEDTNKILSEKLATQTHEMKQLKAENNKHKALQTNIARLWVAEVLKSVEEAGAEVWMSRNKLFKLMRFKNFLKKDNAPYKRFNWTYFIQKTVKHLTGGWRWASYKQTFVTPKGLELLKTTFA